MSTKRALVASRYMLEFDRDTGSQRLLALVEFLREDGWTICFVTQEPGTSDRYTRFLQQRGIPVYVGVSAQVEELISAGGFDLALILYWQAAAVYIPLLRALSPATRIIVDSVDLHFLRTARGTFLKEKGQGAAALLDAGYGSELAGELNTYCAADGVLAVSQKEADLINDLVADPRLAHVLTLSEELPASTVPFSQRKGMLFVGNFRLPPNIGAVKFLCRDILPRLDPSLTAEHPVYIIGNSMNQLVRSYGKELPYVQMLGWVPALRPYLERLGLALVPLQYGAGIKGKVIQALMSGTPVVSTSIGVEGLEVNDGEHLLVADDPARFAECITRLLQDQELWERVSRQGREQMIRTHGRELVRTRLLQIIAEVLDRDPKPALLPTPDEYRPVQHSPVVAERIREIVGLILPSDAPLILFSAGRNETIGLEQIPSCFTVNNS